jgi:uncharacterized protein (DUF2141 family)
VAFTGGCASIGSPTGGPKDEEPPVVVKSIPEQNALNFTGNEIIVEFNELIKITDVSQKLMISPPVNEQPTVTTSARRLMVKFKEDLQPNTTYTLEFADALSDNNEGNILENFRVSFSTGQIIDSLEISGFLFDAQTLAPVASALVMVYANLADSAFRTQVPLRVTKTDSKGHFSIKNLASGKYRVYGLEDSNRNYKYDQPGERIAWYPELVEPYIGTRMRVDSIATDSTVTVEEDCFLPDSLKLFMFQESNIEQYLKEQERKKRNKVDFVFNKGLKEPLKVTVLDRKVNDWMVYEQSVNHDSITLWIIDSTLIKSDSLFLALQYHVLDSLKQDILKSDTINAYFFDLGTFDSDNNSRRKKKDEEVKVLPSLKPEGLKSSLHILQQLELYFATPLGRIDKSALHFYRMEDTIPVKQNFELKQDSVRIRRFVIGFDREPGLTYLFEADSAAFADVYGLASDAIKQKITVKPEESYGAFYVAMDHPETNWLLEVLNKKEQRIRQSVVPVNGKIGFRFLWPGDYLLRIVEDDDSNGEWSTGNFGKGIQPEKVFYFPELINIRANWERVIPWCADTFDIYDFVDRYRLKDSSGNKDRK